MFGSQPFLLQAVAGTMASILSITLVFPFDTVRTRLQTQDRRQSKMSILVIGDLIKTEGWASLYRGWRSLVLSLAVTNFVYFYVFKALKMYASVQTLQQDFQFGIVAGSIAVLISNPFWVVNTRLKLSGVSIGTNKELTRDEPTYKGIHDCFRKLFFLEGIGAFFAGFKESQVLVLNPAINFMIYEFFKRFLAVNLRSFLSSSLLYLIFGGVAKFIATLVTYPLQVIQTRSRAGLPIVSILLERSNYLSTLLFLYRGLESKLTQSVLTSAIMFLTYEHLCTFLINSLNMINGLNTINQTSAE